MTERFFVDTNVLVYARDASEPRKQQQAMVWMEHLWNTQTGRLSVQVLQEFYVTVTGKLAPGLDRRTARSDVRSLTAWRPIPMDIHVIEGAWLVQDRYRLSWWDALIVSAADLGNCRYLLSEDFQEGQVFGNVRVIDPFSDSPETVG